MSDRPTADRQLPAHSQLCWFQFFEFFVCHQLYATDTNVWRLAGVLSTQTTARNKDLLRVNLAYHPQLNLLQPIEVSSHQQLGSAEQSIRKSVHLVPHQITSHRKAAESETLHSSTKRKTHRLSRGTSRFRPRFQHRISHAIRAGCCTVWRKDIAGPHNSSQGLTSEVVTQCHAFLSVCVRTVRDRKRPRVVCHINIHAA